MRILTQLAPFNPLSAPCTPNSQNAVLQWQQQQQQQVLLQGLAAAAQLQQTGLGLHNIHQLQPALAQPPTNTALNTAVGRPGP